VAKLDRREHVIAGAFTTTTSPPTGWPPMVVCTAAVLSPGSGGVMNRDAYSRAPSPLSERWRTFGPTSSDASTDPVAASSLSTRPSASSATYTVLPAGSATMPNGWDANGSAIVRVTARVAESMTLMDAPCLLVTQTSPLLRTASARGAAPTVMVASLRWSRR
jgi:hypothetical protein